MEFKELSREDIVQIHENRLPGGYGVFFNHDGETFATLNMFWNDWNEVKLLIEVAISLPSGRDSLIHCEIVSVDRNPELWAIYDRDETILVYDEVYDLLNHYVLEAGSVSEFGDQSPTTASTTH